MDPMYIKLLVELTIELPFVLFGIAVLHCVMEKFRRKSTGFKTDFFLFYIVQSIVDITDYFVFLIIHRLTRYGLLPFLCAFPMTSILTSTHLFLSIVQRIMHVVIAYNRFAAITSASFAHETLVGKSRQSRRMLVATFVIALVGTAPICASRQDYVASSTPPLMKFVYSASWAPLAASAIVITFTVLTMLACLLLDVLTLVRFRRLSSHRRKALRDDAYLFGFAMLQSFIHILLTFASVTLLIASYTKNVALSFLIQTYYPIVADVYGFSAPICLFLTSRHVRRSLVSGLQSTASVGPTDAHLRRIQVRAL